MKRNKFTSPLKNPNLYMTASIGSLLKKKPEFPCDLLYEIPDSSDPNSGIKWDPILKYYSILEIM